MGPRRPDRDRRPQRRRARGRPGTATARALPDRSAAVLKAIAHARPGGVLVHCHEGRDRSGLLCAWALTLAGAEPGAIGDDYAASFARLPDREGTRAIVAALARRGTTPRAALLDVLATIDLPAALARGGLARGGLTAADVAALRRRLIA